MTDARHSVYVVRSVNSPSKQQLSEIYKELRGAHFTGRVMLHCSQGSVNGIEWCENGDRIVEEALEIISSAPTL